MKVNGIYSTIVKRILDIVISFVALVTLAPLFMIIAIIVRIKLGSPVLFIQERPGKNEKIFKMYKFRSMANATDNQGKLLDDSFRLTNFGKILRSTSLDELPELWNILKGDMSFVGPRPLLVEYLSLYNSEQKSRHLVKPGLTGLAQVSGRNSISWDRKFFYDCKYVKEIGFLLDLKILLLTVKKVFMREGISSEISVTNEKFQGNKCD